MNTAHMTGYASTSMDKTELKEQLSSSKIFSCITHGSQTSLSLSNGSLLISDITALDNGAFDNLTFVYFGACETGAGGNGANNLVNAMYNKGADTVIGFTVNVLIDETNFWTQVFMASIANGNTINAALNEADAAILSNPDFFSRNDISVLGCHRHIVGSTSVAPCD